jgi:hypothetical protein
MSGCPCLGVCWGRAKPGGESLVGDTVVPALPIIFDLPRRYRCHDVFQMFVLQEATKSACCCCCNSAATYKKMGPGCKHAGKEPMSSLVRFLLLSCYADIVSNIP